MSYVQSEATKIKDWRNVSAGKLMTLPSGNVIKLKRVALIDLVVNGGIPDTLSGMAINLISKSNLGSMTAEELKQYEDIVNRVVIAAAAEPRVAATPSDDFLGVKEIDWVDRVQIFNWGNGAATALRPFRPESS